MTNSGRTTPNGAIEGPSYFLTLPQALHALNDVLRQAISTEAELEALSFDQSRDLPHLDGMIALAERKWQMVDTVLFKLEETELRHHEETSILRVASMVNTLRCFEFDPEAAQVFVASTKTRGWLHLHSTKSALSSLVNARCNETLDLFQQMSELNMYGGDGLHVTPEPDGFPSAMAA